MEAAVKKRTLAARYLHKQGLFKGLPQTSCTNFKFIDL